MPRTAHTHGEMVRGGTGSGVQLHRFRVIILSRIYRVDIRLKGVQLGVGGGAAGGEVKGGYALPNARIRIHTQSHTHTH